MDARRRLAGEMLAGASLTETWGGFGTCPGAAVHTGKDGAKDFKVILEGAPTGYCVHKSCHAEVAAWNYQLRLAIWQHEHGGVQSGRDRPVQRLDDPSVASAPAEPKRVNIQALDRAAVVDLVRGMPKIDREWLRRRSPIDVAACDVGQFLNALYRPDEKVLIFTKFTSQGDFIWWVGHGGYRLGRAQGVSSMPSELPRWGRAGVWFLSNPVDGKWKPVKHMQQNGRQLSRRSEQSITSFRFLVLESDELDEALWLQVIAKLPLKIAALYTSGGKSVHALVRVDAGSKPEWDFFRNEIRPLMTKLGADAGAMSAVRLSRLPFTLRHGTDTRDKGYVQYQHPRRQELLWLDAEPNGNGMISQPERRR